MSPIHGSPGADMTWFRHLTIGQKLLVSFGILLLLLGLSLSAILFYLARINSYVERHDRITVPAIVSATDMRRRIYEMTLLLHSLRENRSDVDRRNTLDGMQRLESDTRSALAFYRTTHTARTHPVLFRMLTQHGQAAMADLEDHALDETAKLLEAFGTSWRAMTAHQGKRQEAEADLAFNEAVALTRQLTDKINTLIDLHSKITTEMKSEGDSLFRQSALVILALVVMLGLLIVATYVIVNTQIARPLKSLAKTADHVARHELSAGFDPWPAQDEVGNLARSLGTMLENLRDRTRALERKTRELEGFTYSVAHDLKGPLREIEGFSSLIQQKFPETLNQTTRHYVSKIRTSALRLTALINDLLRYSRLEQQALPMSQVNVRTLIDHILSDRLPAAPQASPLIHVALPFTHVRGEPTSIQQALVNLVGNALKFSRDADPPEISIGGAVRAQERIIWVRDNGIGFDPKDADRIFGLFERLHGQEEHEGTGVGLAIVKLVMEKHGGRVWAESCPGKGSTFFLAFPDAPSDGGTA
ncbi:MAG: HAMP domain-containing protein [Nitrospirae bacterium]|nr:MAG: HAMP domain-containing protein [Nitrospirota bacterium]